MQGQFLKELEEVGHVDVCGTWNWLKKATVGQLISLIAGRQPTW